MSATHILLVGLLLGIALALVITACIARRADTRCQYRTADGATIERDTRRALQLVPSPSITSACTRDCHQGRRCTCSGPRPTDVQARAVHAALRDAPSGITRDNPEREDTEAHVIWQRNYERVYADTRRTHAEAAGDLPSRSA